MTLTRDQRIQKSLLKSCVKTRSVVSDFAFRTRPRSQGLQLGMVHAKMQVRQQTHTHTFIQSLNLIPSHSQLPINRRVSHRSCIDKKQFAYVDSAAIYLGDINQGEPVGGKI